jgi:hypothetical protein
MMRRTRIMAFLLLIFAIQLFAQDTTTVAAGDSVVYGDAGH